MKISKVFIGALAPLTGALLFAPGQVVAQGQSALGAAMLEEIVVTARRREESLMDLPLSVAAISAATMQAQGIYNIDQIGDFIPNLQFNTTDRRHRKAIFIRGIGNDSPVNIIPVGTGVYIDGHYLPNTVGQMLSTVDIERIEVLRGPQGTLFGKNTTGGAISIISAKPHDEFEANVLVRVADFGQQDLRVMVNVPFSDTAFARFSYASEQSDGYYFNRTLNTDTGATDLDAFGAVFRFEPNDNWLIDVGLRVNKQDDDDEGVQCRARPLQSNVDNLANRNADVLALNDPADPAFDPVAYAAVLANHPAQIWTGPVFADGARQWGGSTTYPDGTKFNIGGHLENGFPGMTIAYWDDCTTDNALGDFVTSQEKDTYLELDNENINATITWDSAGATGPFENINFKLIAARHESQFNYTQDRDGSSLPVDAIGASPRDSGGTERNTTTVELLFTADVNDRMSFILGTHYYDDETLVGDGDCLRVMLANLASIETDVGGGTFPCKNDGGTQFDRLADRQNPSGPGIAGMSGIMVNESIAVYGHLTYQLNDDWTLDFGARWTDEDRDFNQVEHATPSCSNDVSRGFPPPTELCGADPPFALSFDSVFNEGFYNDLKENYSEVTPMISLTRNLGGGGGALDDGMVYLSYSEGFLSGSFNDELNVLITPQLASLLTYQPEFVANYEVGFKGSFADGRLRLSSAVFFMDYTDKQESVGIDNSDGRFGGDPNVSITTNAAAVEIYGLEFELRAQPWDGGFISFDVGYLNSEYDSFFSFDPDTALPIDESDTTIRDYSPEWTFNATIEHAFLLDNGATLTPQLGVYYQTEYDFTTGISETAPNSPCFQDSYAKFRARLTYAPEDGAWQASLFGRNIGDERYFEVCGRGRSGAFDYRYGEPDYWGLEFNYNWRG